METHAQESQPLSVQQLFALPFALHLRPLPHLSYQPKEANISPLSEPGASRPSTPTASDHTRPDAAIGAGSTRLEPTFAAYPPHTLQSLAFLLEHTDVLRAVQSWAQLLRLLDCADTDPGFANLRAFFDARYDDDGRLVRVGGDTSVDSLLSPTSPHRPRRTHVRSSLLGGGGGGVGPATPSVASPTSERSSRPWQSSGISLAALGVPGGKPRAASSASSNLVPAAASSGGLRILPRLRRLTNSSRDTDGDSADEAFASAAASQRKGATKDALVFDVEHAPEILVEPPAGTEAKRRGSASQMSGQRTVRFKIRLDLYTVGLAPPPPSPRRAPSASPSRSSRRKSTSSTSPVPPRVGLSASREGRTLSFHRPRRPPFSEASQERYDLRPVRSHASVFSASTTQTSETGEAVGVAADAGTSHPSPQRPRAASGRLDARSARTPGRGVHSIAMEDVETAVEPDASSLSVAESVEEAKTKPKALGRLFGLRRGSKSAATKAPPATRAAAEKTSTSEGVDVRRAEPAEGNAVRSSGPSSSAPASKPELVIPSVEPDLGKGVGEVIDGAQSHESVPRATGGRDASGFQRLRLGSLSRARASATGPAPSSADAGAGRVGSGEWRLAHEAELSPTREEPQVLGTETPPYDPRRSWRTSGTPSSLAPNEWSEDEENKAECKPMEEQQQQRRLQVSSDDHGAHAILSACRHGSDFLSLLRSASEGALGLTCDLDPPPPSPPSPPPPPRRLSDKAKGKRREGTVSPPKDQITPPGSVDVEFSQSGLRAALPATSERDEAGPEGEKADLARALHADDWWPKGRVDPLPLCFSAAVSLAFGWRGVMRLCYGESSASARSGDFVALGRAAELEERHRSESQKVRQWALDVSRSAPGSPRRNQRRQQHQTEQDPNELSHQHQQHQHQSSLHMQRAATAATTAQIPTPAPAPAPAQADGSSEPTVGPDTTHGVSASPNLHDVTASLDEKLAHISHNAAGSRGRGAVSASMMALSSLGGADNPSSEIAPSDAISGKLEGAKPGQAAATITEAALQGDEEQRNAIHSAPAMLGRLLKRLQGRGGDECGEAEEAERDGGGESRDDGDPASLASPRRLGLGLDMSALGGERRVTRTWEDWAALAASMSAWTEEYEATRVRQGLAPERERGEGVDGKDASVAAAVRAGTQRRHFASEDETAASRHAVDSGFAERAARVGSDDAKVAEPTASASAPAALTPTSRRASVRQLAGAPLPICVREDLEGGGGGGDFFRRRSGVPESLRSADGDEFEDYRWCSAHLEPQHFGTAMQLASASLSYFAEQLANESWPYRSGWELTYLDAYVFGAPLVSARFPAPPATLAPASQTFRPRDAREERRARLCPTPRRDGSWDDAAWCKWLSSSASSSSSVAVGGNRAGVDDDDDAGRGGRKPMGLCEGDVVVPAVSWQAWWTLISVLNGADGSGRAFDLHLKAAEEEFASVLADAQENTGSIYM